MKNEIRVLVINPYKGTVEDRRVPNTLESFRSLVGGFIEVVPVSDFLLIVDEEGKWKRKKPCMTLHGGLDVLVGTVVAVGSKGEDFCSLTPRQIGKIKTLYEVTKITDSMHRTDYMPFLNIVTE